MVQTRIDVNISTCPTSKTTCQDSRMGGMRLVVSVSVTYTLAKEKRIQSSDMFVNPGVFYRHCTLSNIIWSSKNKCYKCYIVYVNVK